MVPSDLSKKMPVIDLTVPVIDLTRTPTNVRSLFRLSMDTLRGPESMLRIATDISRSLDALCDLANRTEIPRSEWLDPDTGWKIIVQHGDTHVESEELVTRYNILSMAESGKTFPSIQEIIDKATTQDHYFEVDTQRHGSRTGCPICKENLMDGDSAVEISCGHVYHTYCLSRWLDVDQSCPMCRTTVPILLE